MQFKDDGKFIAVVMEDNEDFFENVKKLVEEFKGEKVLAIISALGMMKEVKMGYWNGKEYEVHEEKNPSELLSISGIITPETDPPYHFHITIGTEDERVKGGHLISARVCNTIEMFLIKGNIEVQRKEEGGLKKLKIL